ncbi:LysR family transcriptional regulator [Pseudomonas syringae]|nr:LysR family transcriptional regulator [Pseudomonas syringae]MBD8573171.1 LysR family transcriptional regulator [Pseudomonas syringae]MBD8790317.1 LysR family transcriptional regulator [Pseudomonas syringae]MBD8799185.1 LysR family transcriptional regulator [Pseudomonas syringae]MBD8810011.1 LysR family transcriptional regulator [Pseudomonas syringae]
MDLDTLKIFDTVAVELSMTRAAARLGRAPSNVTTRIQQLEADLGVELFVRTGKRIGLSSAGQQFRVYAQRMLALEDEARQVIGGGASGGTLRIGSMESTAASRLPLRLAAFNKAWPATRLEVSTGPSGILLRQLRDGQLDCAFVALPPGANVEPELAGYNLQAMALWQEALVLLLPASEAGVSAPGQVRTRTLAAFRPGCVYRAIAQTQLGISAGSSWQVQELGSYHAMVACVAAGSCVTLLPRSVLELCQVPADLPVLDIGLVDTWLVWRQGYSAPAFQHFCAALEQYL